MQLQTVSVQYTVDVDFATSLGAGATYTFHEAGTCIQCLWTGAAWTILTVHSNFAQQNVSGSTGRIIMEVKDSRKEILVLVLLNLVALSLLHKLVEFQCFQKQQI